MSFGFSPSDVITLVQLATKTYNGWKNACGEYADITSMLDGLCVLLGRMHDEADRPGSVLVRNSTDREELRDVLRGCRKTVRELDAVVMRFRSLSSSRKKNWDRVRLGTKDLGALRTKLTQHTSSITAYLETVGLGSLARIEDRLNTIPDQILQGIDGLAAEIRAGRREGSVMTTYEDDEKDVWRQFRRELVTTDGITSSTIHRYKPLIRLYLRKLAEEGKLDEEEPPEEDNLEEEEPLEDSIGEGKPINTAGEHAVASNAPHVVSRRREGVQSSHVTDHARGEEGLTGIPPGLGRETFPLSRPGLDALIFRKRSQPGPRGYFVFRTEPLRNTIANHHNALSRYKYHERLSYVHTGSTSEIARYLSHRKAEGRGEFLNRRIQWGPPREPEDQTELHILLPPFWRWFIDPDRRISFVYHDLDTYGQKVESWSGPRLPMVFDEHAPLPPAWTAQKTSCGRMYWRHRASDITIAVSPTEHPSLEPGPRKQFENLRNHWSGQIVDMAATTLHERGNRGFHERELRRHSERVRRRNGLTVSLWALFPELDPWFPQLRRAARQVMRISWTAELEHANAGMREHLLAWQDRTNNIAGCSSATAHLVVPPSQSQDDGRRVVMQARSSQSDELYRAPQLSRHVVPRGLDYYGISFSANYDAFAIDLGRGYTVAFHDSIYYLSLSSGAVDLRHAGGLIATDQSSELREQGLHRPAAEVLSKIDTLIHWRQGIVATDPRSEHPSQTWRRIHRLAFACFFAPPHEATTETVLRSPFEGKGCRGRKEWRGIWEATATYIRTFFGRVAYHSTVEDDGDHVDGDSEDGNYSHGVPEQRGFVLFLDHHDRMFGRAAQPRQHLLRRVLLTSTFPTPDESWLGTEFYTSLDASILAPMA